MSDFDRYVPEKFSPKTWLPHRNALMAIISLTLAALALGAFGMLPLLRLPASGLVAASVFAFAQFTYSAIVQPYPMDETLTVKVYERGARWWFRFSRPLAAAGHNGQAVYVRDCWDYREIYDRKGRRIGTEQTINWSDTDMDWYPGKPEDVVVKFTSTKTDERQDRMSWLARLRSPELPAVLEPKQAMHPISYLLNGRSEGYITNLTMKAA